MASTVSTVPLLFCFKDLIRYTTDHEQPDINCRSFSLVYNLLLFKLFTAFTIDFRLCPSYLNPTLSLKRGIRERDSVGPGISMICILCLAVAFIRSIIVEEGDRCSTVVKVFCYKSEGRWLQFQLVALDFSMK